MLPAALFSHSARQLRAATVGVPPTGLVVLSIGCRSVLLSPEPV